MLIVSRTLVCSLEGLGLFPTDVNDQCSRTGLHEDFGVFLYIKVGPISCPRKARSNKNGKHHFNRLQYQVINMHSGLFRQTDWNPSFKLEVGLFQTLLIQRMDTGTKLWLIHAARCFSTDWFPWQQLLRQFIFSPHTAPGYVIFSITEDP